MAYRSRFGRRRFGRRNFRRFNRRSYGRRSASRYNRRRRPMSYRRRAPRISPYNKKKDAIQAGHDTNDNIFASIDDPNTIFGYCPTYMPAKLVGETDPVSPQKSRESRFVGYTGYKERVHIATGSSLIWRRFVIWTYERLQNTVGPSKMSGSTPYTTRQITPLENTTTLRTFLFRGTQGIDFSVDNLHEAELNTDHFTVSYDRTRVLNPNRPTSDNFGYVFNTKFWNPGGRIVYNDDEAGSTKGVANGWSANGRMSRGNMYIFDIFSSGLAHTSEQSEIARFMPSGVKYWVEG